MQTVKWSFTPQPAATLATVLALPLLLSLGFWQLDRAAEKQALFDDYNAKISGASVNLNQAVSASLDSIQWRNATVRGRYADTGVFLLDNQVLNGTAGYHVYAPFETEDAKTRIMVNRGWVAAGDYRNEAPVAPMTEGLATLVGTVMSFPSPPGILLDGGDPPTEQLAPRVYRVQVLDQKSVQKLLGEDVSAYVLRLAPDSPTGFARVWPEPGSGRERHLGYAFQWFSLAAALVIIYISVNLKRRKVE